MMNSLEESDALATAVRQETMRQINSLPSSLGLTPEQISETALTRLEEKIQQQISQTVTKAVIQAQAELGLVAIHIPKSRLEDGRTKLGGDRAPRCGCNIAPLASFLLNSSRAFSDRDFSLDLAAKIKTGQSKRERL